jgi:prepilin-type N-terminal cleavage/methylation domain-containing protein
VHAKLSSKSGIVTKKYFTLVELIIVIVIVGVLSMLAIRAFQGIISTAYKVTIEHDLRQFVEMEEIYFTWNRRHFGKTGDYIQGGEHPSGTLVIPDANFVPSDGVRVEIISGNGQSPTGLHCLIARVSHAKLDVIYEYDFATRQTIERQK